MIYLIIFWTLFIAFISITAVTRRVKYKKLKNFGLYLEDKGLLFFMFLGVLAFMAIITKDPIAFGELDFPMEMQWIIALLAFASGAWTYYFNPLKERVVALEKEASSIKTDIASIKPDIHLIKEMMLDSNLRAGRM